MSTLFDESALRRLEQLMLVAGRVRVGAMKGDRRSKRRGTSIEFADYRNYVRGDDLRRLDWNIYARLERPFIKLLEEEEDLAVHILVDASRSMDWPDGHDAAAAAGDTHKLRYALRLAGALGYISLGSGDRLGVTLLRAGGSQGWGPRRGKQQALPLLRFLETAAAEGETDLNRALADYALRGGRPGLLLLLTDLLSPAGYEAGVNALLARGYEVALLQLLSPDELEPPDNGDFKLVDVETGADAEITLDAAMVDQYRERLLAWQNEIAAFCTGRGVHYIPVPTDEPWDRLLLQTMRARGLVR